MSDYSVNPYVGCIVIPCGHRAVLCGDAVAAMIEGLEAGSHTEEAIHAALWDYAEKNGIKIEGLEKPKSDIHEDEEEEEY